MLAQRMRLRVTLLTVVSFVAMFAVAHKANADFDPRLEWSAIETPRFRVSYYNGEREIAERVADLAEAIHKRLSPALGWEPTERTEIVLTDPTDTSNGFATVLPYNVIKLYVCAPDDFSPLGNIDDWYLDLLVHEYTHILQIDHVRGAPAAVNAVTGKTLISNQYVPQWILEGLAIYEESTRTSGGRLRNSMWRMYMRGDVLDANIATLDRFSNTPRKWPQGNIWYLYGSFFWQWIIETYGEDTIRVFIDELGQQLVPFGVNRAMRRATGRTLEELYRGWKYSLLRQFDPEVEAIKKRGIVEGTRITFRGQSAQFPRWLPDGPKGPRALYFRDDNRSRPGIYALDFPRDNAGAPVLSREPKANLVARTNGPSTAAISPSGQFVFDRRARYNSVAIFHDLFETARPADKAPIFAPSQTRLTEGTRAHQADISPDGRKIVFATVHRGTSYLQIADLEISGKTKRLSNIRNLTPSVPLSQASAPRWSPDNRHVAYSVWNHGGFRDIQVVDTADGSLNRIMTDRSLDGAPAYSPDGKTIYFHSDRTGVFNLYAYDISTKEMWLVTNTLYGAFQPSPSPDGKTLLYIGYTSAGYDLYAIAVNRSQWKPAPPSPVYEAVEPPEPFPQPHQARPYNPLWTLFPRQYALGAQAADFGIALSIAVLGADAANRHLVGASLLVDTGKPELQPSLDYTYRGLPFDFSAGVYRTIAPRAGATWEDGTYEPPWIQETVGVSTGVNYSLPAPFSTQSFSVNYTASRIGGQTGPDALPISPYTVPLTPPRGMLGFVSLGWTFSNAEQYRWSVGPARGSSVVANVAVADRALASEFNAMTATLDLRQYIMMPWGREHTLALHAQGGTGIGNLAARSLFYVGGYVDTNPLYIIPNGLVQGGFALRGYPTLAQAGSSFGLFNAEYRFPIWNVDRGLSTLPLFLNRFTGNIFADYGSAFNSLSHTHFRVGTGVELWTETMIMYRTSFLFKLGYAHGWNTGGLNKVYFVASVPF